MENDYNDKVSRVLSLYQRFMEGEVVDKEIEAAGYGVTTRAITLGFFAAFKNTKFNGIGCRFGFELFRDW